MPVRPEGLKMKNSIALSTIFMLFAALAGSPAMAQGASQATVTEMVGTAQAMRAGEPDWKPLQVGDKLSEGDKIQKGADTQLKLELMGNSKTAELVVRKDTTFSLATFRHDEAAQADSTLLDVELGSVLVKAEKLVGSSKFEVKTPTSIVGIRGTTFEVNVQKG
jgi:hypothetical protein